MATLKMSAPWVVLYREIEELFRYDRDVHVVYDETETHIKLFVDDSVKAAALSELMPRVKTFGSVSLQISVIPSNGDDVGKYHLYETCTPAQFKFAFEGNDAVSFIKTVSGVFTNNLTYIAFKKRVVQYFNDDIGDAYGQCSTLYQDIAKRVFGDHEGVFFCTDRVDPVDDDCVCAPLGEWP